MVLVERRGVAALSARASSRVQRHKKKPYKVVLESITAEKKKLRSAISYDAQSPQGYTFVPAGIPELSEFCKELCRKRSLVVHIVSAAPKNKASMNPEKISHHIHRIGYHFPNAVVDQACDWLGYSIRGGKYQKDLDVIGTSRLARRLAGHKKGSQKDTTEQVKAAMSDLFPKLPENDLDEIVKHAFRSGTKRVGNAQDLSLSRRVQLAVIAHIRHVYTDYDKLLKEGTYQEARTKVEQPCLDKLREWRGEVDDGGESEFEDIFRETIVIDTDDDDDDDDDSGNESVTGHMRGQTLEIVSREAAAHDLQPEEYAPEIHHETSRSYRAGRRILLVPSSQRPEPSYMRPIMRERVVSSGTYQSVPSSYYTDRSHQNYIVPSSGRRTAMYSSAYPAQPREIVYVRDIHRDDRAQPSALEVSHIPNSSNNQTRFKPAPSDNPQPIHKVVYERPEATYGDRVMLRAQHENPKFSSTAKYGEPASLHSRPLVEHQPQQRRPVDYKRILDGHHLPQLVDEPVNDRDMPIPSVEDPDARESLSDLRLADGNHRVLQTRVEPQASRVPRRELHAHDYHSDDRVVATQPRRVARAYVEPEPIASAHSRQRFVEDQYYERPQLVQDPSMPSLATTHTHQYIPIISNETRPHSERYIVTEAKSPRTQLRSGKVHSSRYDELGHRIPTHRHDQVYEHKMAQSYRSLEQAPRRLISPSNYHEFVHEPYQQNDTIHPERTYADRQVPQHRRIQSDHSQIATSGISAQLKEPFNSPPERRPKGSNQIIRNPDSVRHGSSEDPIVIEESPPRKKRAVPKAPKGKQPPPRRQAHPPIPQRRANPRHQHKDRKPIDPDNPAIPLNSGVVPRRGISGNGVVAERALAEQVWDNY